MKNRKITLVASLMLVIVMLFSTFSVAAVDGDLVTTTAPTGVPTTVPSTEDERPEGYWEGYYDGYNDGVEDTENEDYDSGYEDGYNAGKYDGYWAGYYEGYYDGVNAFEEPSIIEKIENLNYELIYRLEMFLERVRDFFERLFKIGDYAPVIPVDPDAGFIPDGSQANLAGDAEAEALCLEFNNLVDDFKNIKEPVAITKSVDVDIIVNDVPYIVQGVVNDLVEQFLIDDSVTNNYVEGDYAYSVQSISLFPEGLTTAEKIVNADGTTDYKFVVIEEAAYYNGHYTTGLKYIDGGIVETELQHDYVADTLYIEAADLEPITISTAEIVYPGATVTAKTDANGRLIAYDIDMPVNGKGTAKFAGGITVKASLEGHRNEGFVMEYAS